MVRSIKILLFSILICAGVFAQTTNKIVYEGNLDSLVRVNPFAYQINQMIRDSISIGGGDTSHYSLISWVINLQDSLDDKLNRSEYSPSGFDTTYICDVIDSIKNQDFTFSGTKTFNEAIFAPAIYGDPDSITHVELSVAGGTHIGYDNDGIETHTIWTGGAIQFKKDNFDEFVINADSINIKGNITSTDGILAYSVSPSEMSYLDGVTSDIQTQFNTLDNYIDSNYVLTSELNDSNYVLTSETSAWDKDASNDMLASAFDDSVDHYIDNTAYSATTWDADTIKAPSRNAVRDVMETKQATLVSGTNIKTIDGATILGSGDITLTNSYQAIFSEEVLIDAGSAVAHNTFFFINQTDPATFDIIFEGMSIVTTVYIKVINIGSGGAVTLYTHGTWNGTDADIVLTDADNGSTFIVVYSPTLTYWYQIL